MRLGVGVLLVVEVFHGHAPGGVIGSWLGTAFRARLDGFLRQSLESTRFLEAPMPSLFHLELPLVKAHQGRWIIVSPPPA
jgi:hypothetical protein